jgi:hypothetical protein
VALNVYQTMENVQHNKRSFSAQVKNAENIKENIFCMIEASHNILAHVNYIQ